MARQVRYVVNQNRPGRDQLLVHFSSRYLVCSESIFYDILEFIQSIYLLRI